MLSGLVCQAAFKKQRHPDVMMDVRPGLGLSGACGKDQLAPGALWLPLLERIDHNRGEGDVTLTGLGFRWPHVAPVIGPLTDMNYASSEIDTGPAQSPQFAQAHSGEYRGDDKGTPPGCCVVDQEIEFGH